MEFLAFQSTHCPVTEHCCQESSSLSFTPAIKYLYSLLWSPHTFSSATRTAPALSASPCMTWRSKSTTMNSAIAWLMRCLRGAKAHTNKVKPNRGTIQPASISLGIIQSASWKGVSLRCPYQLATVSFLTAVRLHASCLNNNAATTETGRAQCLQRRTDHTLFEYSRSCWGILASTARFSCLNRCLNRTENSNKRDMLLTNDKLLWKPYTCCIPGLFHSTENLNIWGLLPPSWDKFLIYRNLNSTLAQQSG